MKKLISGILVIVLGISMVACSNAKENSTSEIKTETDPAGKETTLEDNQKTNSTDKKEETSDSSETSEGSKVLVAYFSYSGNTKGIAEQIQEQTGADIFEIKTTQEYPEDYDEVLDQAQEEQQANARPELNATVDNIQDYDVVFLGYPNWWGDMPMAVYSFLDTYDLSGKTVIPFCTHGGSGLSGTEGNIASEEPGATMMEGVAIQDSNLDGAGTEIEEWLSDLGIF